MRMRGNVSKDKGQDYGTRCGAHYLEILVQPVMPKKNAGESRGKRRDGVRRPIFSQKRKHREHKHEHRDGR